MYNGSRSTVLSSAVPTSCLLIHSTSHSFSLFLFLRCDRQFTIWGKQILLHAHHATCRTWTRPQNSIYTCCSGTNILLLKKKSLVRKMHYKGSGVALWAFPIKQQWSVVPWKWPRKFAHQRPCRETAAPLTALCVLRCYSGSQNLVSAHYKELVRLQCSWTAGVIFSLSTPWCGKGREGQYKHNIIRWWLCPLCLSHFPTKHSTIPKIVPKHFALRPSSSSHSSIKYLKSIS